MEINLARKTLKREKHLGDMEDVLAKLISISCECFDDQKNTNNEQISQPLWEEMMGLFV